MTEPLRLPRIGDRIIYTLTETDGNAINIRRLKSVTQGGAFRGNSARAGQQLAGVVVQTFDPHAAYANLQLFCDGNDQYWVTSVPQGTGEGQFHFA